MLRISIVFINLVDASVVIVLQEILIFFFNKNEYINLKILIFKMDNKKKYNIFYWPGTQAAFNDVGKTVQHHISFLGYDIAMSKNLDRSRINIVFGVNACIKASDDTILNQIPSDSIIINMEQLSAGAWSHHKYINVLKRFRIWDYSSNNIKWMIKQGIKNIQKINIGYSDALKSNIVSNHKDIDVLFYGAINDRRKNILDKISSHKNIKLYYSNYGLFEKERDIMVSRSKIVLNIHYYQKNVFEVVRVSHLLSNKAFVISEIPDSNEEREYWDEALVFTEYNNIVNTIIKYISDDDERTKISDRGYDVIKSRPFSLPIPRLEVKKETVGEIIFLR